MASTENPRAGSLRVCKPPDSTSERCLSREVGKKACRGWAHARGEVLLLRSQGLRRACTEEQ